MRSSPPTHPRGAMLTIRSINNTDAIALLCGSPPGEDTAAAPADRGAVFALVAEEGGELVGFAVAESHPRAVHFFGLEGDTDAARFLLERLVRLAGERDVCGWCRARRGDVRRLLLRLGFRPQIRVRSNRQPWDFYHLSRND